ncbi:unnamed protein product [Durusdinium trenchii]|uniref:Arf-GAP domain-containing protein n=1 Tax=Durusdinium trenchii TaxID=1381693 RepID=A0ABP0SCX7_9DINO
MWSTPNYIHGVAPAVPVAQGCPAGHLLTLRWTTEVGFCGACGGPCMPGRLIKTCDVCRYNVCEACTLKATSSPTLLEAQPGPAWARAPAPLRPAAKVPNGLSSMPVPVARTCAHAAHARSGSLTGVDRSSYISYVPSYLAGSNGRSYVPPVQGAESRSYVPPAEGAGGPSYAPCEAGKTGTDGWSYTPFVTGGGSYVPPEPGGPSYVPPAQGSPSYIPAVAASTGNRSYVPPGPGDTARYTATPVPLRYADVRTGRSEGSYIPPFTATGSRSWVPAPETSFTPPSRRPYGATMTLPSGGSFIQVPEAKLSNRSPSLTPSYTPSIESFVVTAWPGAKTPPEVKGSKKALSLEEHAALPENQECADCGAPRPDWASVNQGTLICIDCAGTHRSLGAHISKVKSLGLDKWKPDEVENFVSKGGNRKVNESLRKGGAPVAPQLGAPRAAWDIYIRRKYAEKAPLDTRLNGYHPKSLGAAQAGGSPSEGEGLKAVVPERSLNLHRELSCHLGTTCHQGLVMVDIASVDIGVERAQDLRMLGRFFLSLSVVLSLGSVTTDGTSSRRGSEKASWNPPERKELLWDAQERWLWCRVYDWDLIGFKQLAGEGRIDLLQFMERHGACGAQGVEVELFASSEDDGGSDSEASPTSHPTSFGTFNPEDPQDPAWRGTFIGLAKLQLTIIDMTGMLSSQQRKPIAQSESPSGSD